MSIWISLLVVSSIKASDVIFAAIVAFIITYFYNRKVSKDEYYRMSLYDSDKPYICILKFDYMGGGSDYICGYTNMKESDLGHFGIELFRTSYVLKLMPFVMSYGMELRVVDREFNVLKKIDMNRVVDMNIVFRRNPEASGFNNKNCK